MEFARGSSRAHVWRRVQESCSRRVWESRTGIVNNMTEVLCRNDDIGVKGWWKRGRGHVHGKVHGWFVEDGCWCVGPAGLHGRFMHMYSAV